MIDLIYVFKKIALLIVWGTDYEWARENREISNKAIVIARARTNESLG